MFRVSNRGTKDPGFRAHEQADSVREPSEEGKAKCSHVTGLNATRYRSLDSGQKDARLRNRTGVFICLKLGFIHFHHKIEQSPTGSQKVLSSVPSGLCGDHIEKAKKGGLHFLSILHSSRPLVLVKC